MCIGECAHNLQDEAISVLYKLNERLNEARHSGERKMSIKHRFWSRRESKDKTASGRSRETSVSTSTSSAGVQHPSFTEFLEPASKETYDMPIRGEVYNEVHHPLPYQNDVNETSWQYTLPSTSDDTQFLNFVEEPAQIDPRSASEAYLGDHTNPFGEEQSTTGLRLEREDNAMYPPPLRPRAPRRQAPKEPERGSQSSATSEELVTPTFPPELTYALPVAETRNGYSVNGMKFPAPPNRAASSSDNPKAATPVEQSSRNERADPTYMPPGTIQSALRTRTYGMPTLSNHDHVNVWTAPTTLRLIGPKGYIPPPETISKRPPMTLDDRNITGRGFGFCKGAQLLQSSQISKAYLLGRRPGAIYGRNAVNPYFQCKKCDFEGRAIEAKNAKGKDEVFIDSKVYGSDGILYRWEFLFRCHVQAKKAVRHPLDSAFGCPFCAVEKNGFSIFGGVASFLDHLQTHRKSEPSKRPNAEMRQRMNAIVDRSPAIEEDFAVALPPIYI